MKYILRIFLITMVFFTTKILFTNADIDFSQISSGDMIILEGGENTENKDSFIKDDLSKKNISLPLKNTSVESEISGFVGRTTVTQVFQNPYDKPIEAIYLFPLPHDASVDSMTMQIGERKIVGKIEKKSTAEEMYQNAKDAGKTASVLHQQRDNIFTQKVANILPGEEIKIHISYFETIKYEKGKYNYIFPMVVGPRYSPSSLTDSGSIISPTIPKDYIDGHKISLHLKINAGVKIKQLFSPSHDVDIKKVSDNQVEVSLKNIQEIPNKDFSFEYNVAGDKPQIGFLFHKDEADKDGYFTLLVEPQKDPSSEEIRNKEIVFVLDTSGSMDGRPIESVKKAMQKSIENLGENDYVNIYSFNDGVEKLYSESKKANNEVKKEALSFVNNLEAGGGTVMDEPFKEALKDKGEYEDRMRIILIMTDGDIGNETDILHTIKTNLGNNRVFALGVDAASNRYLLDNISEAGKGKTTYILENDNIDEKVNEFYDTFKSPLLTDINIDWGGMNVFDLLPKNIPDLYDGQPIKITGKYKGDLNSSIQVRNILIKAKNGNNDFSTNIPIIFPNLEKENNSLKGLWAKYKVKDIYAENLYTKNPKLEEEVTALGLNYNIMTDYTSFIAIDDQTRVTDLEYQTVNVPNYEVDGKKYNMGRKIGGGLNFGSTKPTGIAGSISTGDLLLDNVLRYVILIVVLIFILLIGFFVRKKLKKG